jgi:hypothetical protein
MPNISLQVESLRAKLQDYPTACRAILLYFELNGHKRGGLLRCIVKFAAKKVIRLSMDQNLVKNMFADGVRWEIRC